MGRQVRLVMLVPPMSIKDCTVADLVVLATYSGKPNTSAIPLCEKTTTHWAWEMVRVACTHLVNALGDPSEG